MASSNLLSRLVIGLARLCGMISALLIILVLAVVSYAVIQRYVLQTPLLWGDEFIGYVLVSIIMFGTAEALRKNDHISIDLLTSRAKPHHQRFVRIWGDTAVFLFGPCSAGAPGQQLSSLMALVNIPWAISKFRPGYHRFPCCWVRSCWPWWP